jgi:hypothetical protein
VSASWSGRDHGRAIERASRLQGRPSVVVAQPEPSRDGRRRRPIRFCLAVLYAPAKGWALFWLATPTSDAPLSPHRFGEEIIKMSHSSATTAAAEAEISAEFFAFLPTEFVDSIQAWNYL